MLSQIISKYYKKVQTIAPDSLGQGQELAVDGLVGKGTPKTVSANHCHTEHRTQRGKPYMTKKHGCKKSKDEMNA